MTPEQQKRIAFAVLDKALRDHDIPAYEQALRVIEQLVREETLRTQPLEL